MKKIFLSVIALVILSVQAFALENRYFEIRTEVPVSVSNTTFFLSDILKEDLVIDLPSLHDTVPNSGFKISVLAQPSWNINLDLRSVYVGFRLGADAQASFNVSKGIFDFFAIGNELNQKTDIDVYLNADLFLALDTTVSFDVHDFRVTVIPGFFFPIAHAQIGNSNSFLQNDEHGAFVFNAEPSIDLYWGLDLGAFDSLNFSLSDLFAYTKFGFDLAGSVAYEIFNGFTVSGYMRIPMVPGRLTNQMHGGVYAKGNLDLMGMFSGEGGMDFDFGRTEFDEVGEANYKIHRPFKMMVGANWDGFGEWLDAYVDLGMGVRYPFSKAAKFYPEYILGVDFSLVNILGASFRTQYCEQIFSHKASIFMNTRVFEIDVGISTESPSFIGSFKVAGLGAYIGFALGF